MASNSPGCGPCPFPCSGCAVGKMVMEIDGRIIDEIMKQPKRKPTSRRVEYTFLVRKVLEGRITIEEDDTEIGRAFAEETAIKECGNNAGECVDWDAELVLERIVKW